MQADAVQGLMSWAENYPQSAGALIAVYKPLVTDVNRSRTSQGYPPIPNDIMLGPGDEGTVEYHNYRRGTIAREAAAARGMLGKGPTVIPGKGADSKGTSAARSRTPHVTSRVRDVREIGKMSASAAADPVRAADQAIIDQRSVINLSNLGASSVSAQSTTVPPPPVGPAPEVSNAPLPPTSAPSVNPADEPMQEAVPPESEDIRMDAPANVPANAPDNAAGPPAVQEDAGMAPYVDPDDDLPDFDEDEDNREPGNVVEGAPETIPVPEDPPGLDPAGNDDAEIPDHGDVAV